MLGCSGHTQDTIGALRKLHTFGPTEPYFLLKHGQWRRSVRAGLELTSTVLSTTERTPKHSLRPVRLSLASFPTWAMVDVSATMSSRLGFCLGARQVETERKSERGASRAGCTTRAIGNAREGPDGAIARFLRRIMSYWVVVRILGNSASGCT